MSARKLQQEVDRTFKRVDEGVIQFEQIYEKLQQCQNVSQKEKLEDSLKREIKKLQRHRDLIKTWIQNSEIKDKKPLTDKRKLIETQMEKFKAVEKEMKTKAYSKEGLLASARLDPKAQQKQDLVNFLSDCTSELERLIETAEAEREKLEATQKRGKKMDTAKADRIGELEDQMACHRFHLTKIEMLMRALENGKVDVEQVERIKDDIKYYIDGSSAGEIDYVLSDWETLYEDLNLDDELAEFGVNLDNDRQSSQDTASIAEDETTTKPVPKEPTARRSSSQVIKSPIPAPSTLHTSTASFPVANGSSMKPAPIPTRPAGELKYASVATAAAAAEKNVGIAPLPPPPGHAPVQPSPPAAPTNPPRQPAQSSPSTTAAHPPEPTEPSPRTSTTPPPPSKTPSSRASTPQIKEAFSEPSPQVSAHPSPTIAPVSLNGTSNGVPPQPEPARIPTPPVTAVETVAAPPPEEECIYHLPAGLQDLMSSFEITKKRITPNPPPDFMLTLESSYLAAPDSLDAEKPRHYRPEHKHPTPAHYPQEPLAVFDDPSLYRKIDTDTLFYVFYYKQGTYQQYLAAKELKRQSWRFHKQYQTWFQRHEEPKNITEEFEQGTYRFFDYESTWLVSRKFDSKEQCRFGAYDEAGMDTEL